ncbi:hypothetical protein ACWEQ1_17275 [Streptomyces nodosus]
MWEQVKDVLPQRGGAVWESSDHQAVVEAILWKLGTGARWDGLGMPAGSHITIRSGTTSGTGTACGNKSHDVPRYVDIAST